MFDLFATVLAWFYDLIPNYAVAIGLLTLSIMILLTPLTLKGTKGMLELQRLQPEMKRIQQQHRGDRQKMNEEMMKLYQEHKVNPLGGCLPLLIQAPVFIILYRVLIGLTQRGPDGFFDPRYLDQSSQMYQDLHSSTEMLAFGLDLSQKATDVIRDSVVSGLPYLALVLLVAVLSYVQQWQITARNKNQPVNPQQKILLRVLPGFFAVISLTLPSGIIFYFLVSNMYRIAQQAYITRRFYRDKGELVPSAPIEAEATETTKRPAPAKSTKTPAKSTKTPAKPAPKPKPAPRTARPAPKSGAKRPTPPSRPKPQPKKKP